MDTFAKNINQIMIFQGITPDQLFAQIEIIIEKKLNEKITQFTPSNKWHYMSRKEVAEQLRISLPTLHEWTKQGLLKPFKIGKRVLYRSDEVEESITGRKHKKYS